MAAEVIAGEEILVPFHPMMEHTKKVLGERQASATNEIRYQTQTDNFHHFVLEPNLGKFLKE